MANILAIVGRPNVGKSTLFNRLVGGRQAIVDPTSGVTRDRNYGKSDWNGIEFSIIDTGGYVEGSDDVFEAQIRKQAKLAIEEADVILFMVDVNEGVTPLDEAVADIMRRSKKTILLTSNKVDLPNKSAFSSEFYALGMGEVYSISAMTGSGTGELLDEVVSHFQVDALPPEEDLPKFAVIGRPNVGKSSLINAFLGFDKLIVTDIAGTTRDSILTKYNAFGYNFYLVDTAGVRKKKKVFEDIEFYSVMRSMRAIEDSDVCILMFDATQGFEAQDMSLLTLVQKNHKGAVIVVNKWDLLEKETNTLRDYENALRLRIKPFSNVPIIFTSVPDKQRLLKVLETATRVSESRKRKIPTSQLNETLLPIVEASPPPAHKGKYMKIKYITMLKTYYPSFVFFCNLPQYIREPYKRFLENKIRELYDFEGVPMEIYFREK
ncbi:MAG: ribosome biogenesis GTPase Der [Bacteroidales bacterium]|jgi:GTP-binding protein|nr:ribosome biogenesis GTPase Der [Bacteroidales bacterium]